jgi:hypothetical protein
MKTKPPEKIQKATSPSTRGQWSEMNRKQRREMMRQIQSEDLSVEVVHPHAAGIDIGDESNYVAVPPTRDSQPVRHFGCTTYFWEIQVFYDPRQSRDGPRLVNNDEGDARPDEVCGCWY